MIDVPHHLALCITSKKYHANFTNKSTPSASLILFDGSQEPARPPNLCHWHPPKTSMLVK
jgi:hypothetical protein